MPVPGVVPGPVLTLLPITFDSILLNRLDNIGSCDVVFGAVGSTGVIGCSVAGSVGFGETISFGKVSAVPITLLLGSMML